MPRLPGVLRDAVRLRETLTKFADRPTHMSGWLTDGDASKQEMMDGLSFLAATARSEDQVVVYIASHCFRERDETHRHWRYWLLPWDATPETAEQRGISTDELGAALQRIEAREVVLILDCCNAGGLPDIRWLNGMQEELQDGWRSVQIIATARGMDDVIDTRHGGLFMREFCKALAGEAGVTDKEFRVYAQAAACHAAVVANGQAALHGGQQVAVLAGFAAPIPLTRIRPEDSTAQPRHVSVYSKSQDKAVQEEVMRLIAQSRRIRLVGTGLSVLWHRDVLELLFQRARRPDVEIDICLGNPFNPSVQSRLIEEEMLHCTSTLGADGIARHFETYLKRIEALGAPGSINVRLFESNPTFATLIFDDNVFQYPYGYRTLGTDSPVWGMIDDGRDDVRFYIDHADRVIGEAVPAVEVSRVMHNPRYVGETWTAAAIYAVPEATHPLYTLGSRILGYDLRAGTPATGRNPVAGFRRFVGEAVEYGFHATIGDALYFGTDAALERAKAELRFLTRQFSEFELTELALAHPFHDNPEIVALRCRDESGVAEALHHEIVSRIYSRAISTTYKAGTTSKAVPQTPRTQLMVEKYGAPFILGAFEPHFTLGSSYIAADDEGGKVLQRLREAVRGPCSHPIRIRELRLLVKPAGATRWTLDPERFDLQVKPTVEVYPFRGKGPRRSRRSRPPGERP